MHTKTVSLWAFPHFFVFESTHTCLSPFVTSKTHTEGFQILYFFHRSSKNQFNHPVTTTCTLSSSLFTQDFPPQSQFHARIWIITLELCYVTRISLCVSVKHLCILKYMTLTSCNLDKLTLEVVWAKIPESVFV